MSNKTMAGTELWKTERLEHVRHHAPARHETPLRRVDGTSADRLQSRVQGLRDEFESTEWGVASAAQNKWAWTGSASRSCMSEPEPQATQASATR